MDRVQKAMASQFPDIRTFFSSGSHGGRHSEYRACPRPLTCRSAAPISTRSTASRRILADRIRELPGVGQIYIPQDMNYPALRLDVDRVHAGELGLTQKDVVDNVITALNSNYMIAPNYWVDRQSGNDYYLTVQYFEHGSAAIHNMLDLGQIPLRDPECRAE